MKKIIALLATVSLAGIAQASLTVYEPFNYTTSIPNNTTGTGTGESGAWTCGTTPSIVTGLTYTGLPVANSAASTTGGRMFVGLASPLSSGTKWVSYLFKCSGDPGGNFDGIYLKGDQASSLWAGFRGGVNGTLNVFGLATVTSAGTGTTGGTPVGSSANIVNNTVHLIVLKIDFNTSGANDTVTLYIDPAANASSPSVGATTTVSTVDVGSISALGLNAQGGTTMTVDEFRVGDNFGDVVGYVPPPAAPTGLVATPGVNAVGLSWDATSGATGYKVLRGTSTGVYNTTNRVTLNTNFDNTVVGGTTYFYVVQATNSSGASASSSEVSVTPTIALPAPPGGLTAVGTNGAVILNWTGGAGAASYNVKRSTTTGAEATIASVGTTSYADTGVVNGTTYFYVISSTNNAGESANTSEASATPDVPPAAPTGLSATAGTNQVALSWTGSAGAASYKIKRSTTSGSGYLTIGTTTAPTVAYTDSTAVKFTQYFYVVSAVSGNGEGANSSPQATATPLGAYGPSDYEPFNYALGNLANNTPSTGIGFTGNWTVSAFPNIVAGLTYSNLPTTANAYQHAAAGAQTTENFATPLSSGTKYISFLFKGSGNSGGDTVGVFFKGNNASSLFAGFRVPDTAVTTGFGLGTVNSTTLGGAAALGSAININNTSVHLIVLKIDFNTSGANDTVSLWIDPPAVVNTPGVAANVVNSTFDVGAISAFGINITGGYNPVIDEVRVGDFYGDVVGYGVASTPTIPTSVSISVAQGKQVSWTASAANSYQPQKSSDNTTWTNFGGFFAGNSVTSVYQTSPAPYYRVLEFLPGAPGPNVMVNGSFETAAANNIGAANWNGPASNGTANQYVTNQYDVLTPTDGTSLLLMEGTNGTGSLVQSDLLPISGGLTYKVVFDAANPVRLNGANPQYQVEFFDAGNGFISNTGFGSLQSIGSTWTTISNNYAAPANAASMHIQFLEAVGGGAHWVTLIDNIRVSTLAGIGSTNILSPTLQLGATFTGTVISNGLATAMQASGTITFLTNNAALSTNTVALGIATSATAIISPSYTVKAIYSGDGNFLPSTNTLTVNNASATVVLNNLNQTFDGTARIVSAATTPPGLLVNLTYNANASAPTNAGSYQVIGTVSDALYAGSATNTLTVAKAAATVTLGSLSQTYDGTGKSATSLTAPLGLTVIYTYNGSASAPVNIGTYQVIGLVSDINYFGGATNSLVIVSGISSTPTNITATVSGNQLTLGWPSDHRGWILQAQTNSTATGMTTNWVDLPGSETNIQSVINIDPANPTVFFRLRTPPTPVQPPTGLQTTASGTPNSIGLAWTASPSAGVIGYRILYGTDSNNLTNVVDAGNVTSSVISGLTTGQTYYLAVVALTADGQSLAVDATISAQPDASASIVPLFNLSTPLEPATSVTTSNALITYLADRARDRHAREGQFALYDHYLSWYWEQRVANIEIIDHVAKGGTDITFNYTTQDQLNPAEFRTFFRGITTVAEYQNNQQATLVSSNVSGIPGEMDFHYTATINANAQYNRPLQLGDRVEIEISQFLLDPRHGRDNYYGTVLLYIVGQGIVPWQEGQDAGLTGGVVGGVNQNLDSYPIPTNGWLGGLTTLPYQYSQEPAHHFKELAGNISPTNGLLFMLGRRLHHTDFGDGTHSEPDNPVFTAHVGQLGPKFVNRSCVACHVNNGRALPPAIGAPMLQSVVKVGSDANGTPHPTLGSVLQFQSTSGPSEGSATIASYTTTSGQYGDGAPYSLQKPNYTFQGTTPSYFSVRVAPQLVGLGLLEAVSESTISALADPNDSNHDGISGRMQSVTDPETSQQRLGRFNYKAGKARLSHQVAGALNNDMGVATSIFPVLDGDTTNSAPEVNAADLDKMTRYIALLGVSARRDLTNAQALQGEQLFASANCVKCHVATLTTSPYHPQTELRNQTIHPYTDLLLHDMGTGLADNMGEGVATGAEWRTPPLWSIGLTAGISGGEAYLHDGRARTIEEAILWHGGEAEASKEIFRNMTASERAAVIKFLKSL